MSRQLKCGLEIHSQLNTMNKLFSLTPTAKSLLTPPNTKISYFDIGVPGTQPKLNKEALLLSLKAAVALNCDISSVFSFDRKHYFYGDQPLGYQITQHYQPFAKNGFLKLSPRYDDGIKEEKVINIEQIQIEQDTGKSMYKLSDHEAQIDFNRGNVPLIEMVTKPDFSNIDEIKAFIKKFQNILVNLGVCTGELETGAMRVDVNISVGGNSRVELKNLATTSAIVHAVRHEYKRQCDILDKGGKIDQVETRGWDGKTTVRLRSKESYVDYRYMPDPELPLVKLNVQDLIPKLSKTLPITYEEKIERLLSAPYNLKLRDASVLLKDESLLAYYEELYQMTSPKNPIHWLIHELEGNLTKLEIPSFSKDLISVSRLAELINAVNQDKLSLNNGKLLLMHLLSNPEDQIHSIEKLATDFDLMNDPSQEGNVINIEDVVDEVLSKNQKAVDEITKSGKLGRVNFLLGQCMQLTNRKLKPKDIEGVLKAKLGIKQ